MALTAALLCPTPTPTHSDSSCRVSWSPGREALRGPPRPTLMRSRTPGFLRTAHNVGGERRLQGTHLPSSDRAWPSPKDPPVLAPIPSTEP